LRLQAARDFACAACRLSKTTIGWIWQTFGLQSHRIDMFKLSADPQFVQKGPQHYRAVFLSTRLHARLVDVRKNQVQALDRY